MVDRRALLNDIWELFRVAGVSNHLAITEHIAAVLLEITGGNARPHLLKPQEYPGSELDPGTRAQIRQLINEAEDSAPRDAAELLDPLTLFREPQVGFEGQYPTPRHLVALMHRVCEVWPEHAILDPACGSGGFLTHVPAWDVGFLPPEKADDEPAGSSLGLELAQSWARIAYANTRLRFHDDPVRMPEIQNRNALRPDAAPEWPRRFDRVLMNPPFGTRVDRELLRYRKELNLSTTADVVLANQALDWLKPGGCAGILLPESLFGVTSAEAALRQRLFDEHHLRAVIALPPDALQPFSGTPAYLVVAEKDPTMEGDTWFFTLQRDGYPPGRSRDLTRPPDEPSDFPLLEAAMEVSTAATEFDLDGYTNLFARVAVVPVKVGGKPAVGGVIIQSQLGMVIERIDWHAPTGDSQRWGLVVLVGPPNNPSMVWIRPHEWLLSRAESRGSWRQYLRTLGEPDPERLREQTVYLAADPPEPFVGGETLVITAEGELLGRRVPTYLVQESDDLRPQRWMSPPTIPAASTPERRPPPRQPPDTLRGGPATPQAHTEAAGNAQVEEVWGATEAEVETAQPAESKARPEAQPQAGPAAVAQPLVPRAAARPEVFADARELEVFGTLSTAQERVYNAVRALPPREAAVAGGTPYSVVVPFGATDLEAVLEKDGGGELHPGFVDETLSLLEAMGILVRAHLAPNPTSLPVPYYRLATPWDQPAELSPEPAVRP